MRATSWVRTSAIILAAALCDTQAGAQTAANQEALRGLAPVSALGDTDAGKAALAANLTVTGQIQDGTARQPTLLPFPAQQQQALRDAYITGGNASELADGLGSKLSTVYWSRASYTSNDGGKTAQFTNIGPTVAKLFSYAGSTTESDAHAGKYFFANATLGDAAPAPAATMTILTAINGSVDVFGKAYHQPAGSKGADPFGNSRPFQTEPHLVTFAGKDFFGVQSTNVAYLRGPTQDLTSSPSYPSGHTTYGYTDAVLLALLVPQRYPQMISRAAEYGNDRIIIGAHYAMDVLGGRTLALFDLAQLLANKPGYVGVQRHGVQIADFPAALAAARTEMGSILQTGCGGTVAVCSKLDHGRFANPAATRMAYEATQTYNLPVVYVGTAGGTEDVGKLAPEAGYLLTAAFPYLNLAQADAILTSTEGPGGGFLDNGSAFGVYSRLDLYRAAEKAISVAPTGEHS